MNQNILLFFLIFLTHSGRLPIDEKPSETILWEAGQGDYGVYRIPSLLVTGRGTVLAFCEGRSALGDAGDIDLIVRRSADNGDTWSATQVVWDDGPNTCGNPCPVVDAATGRIWLWMTRNLGADREGDIIRKTSSDTRRAFLCYSDDEGQTWSKPVDMTAMVKDSTWGWYATGPGIGIQYRGDRFRGRLIIPANHSYDDPQGNMVGGSFGYGAHVLISDDHGATWRRSAPIRPGCNESQLVELADGSLLMNMRSYHGTGCRAVARSADGGETWSDIRHDKGLEEPVCQASIIHYGPGEGRDIFLFSNPASQTGRHHLTIKASTDNCATWPVVYLVWESPSAYSCLTRLPNGEIGLLYERGEKSPYESIAFYRLGTGRLFPEHERALLLQSNDRQREAHLQGDAAMLAAELADSIVTVQDGDIRVATREETQARFENYFPSVRYRKWDDVAPPKVFFSGDDSQALVVVRKIIQAMQLQPDGAWQPDATLFAWTSNYRKEDGKWQIFSITSTREALGEKSFQDFYSAGTDALKTGNLQAALTNLERTFYLNPSSPAVQLDYARVLAKTGANGPALQVLGNLVHMGAPAIYHLQADSAMQQLAGEPAFTALCNKAAQAAQPVNHSVVLASVSERDLIPEGLAYDERNGSVYLSSTYQRKIIRIDRNGRASDFITPKQDGIWSTIGMEVDEARGVIWVATAHANGVLPLIDPEPENEWKTAVFKYDLSDGHLIKSYPLLINDGSRRFFNDLTVSSVGDVYITETGNADVYLIPAGTDELGLFYHEPDGRTFFNGLALSADERFLYVAHAEGILRLDMVTRVAREVEHPPYVTLQGVDGLAMYQNSLIAHQSSLLNRLMRYRLDETGLRVTGAEVLEGNNPLFDQSTTGELTGDGAYLYLANAQMQSAFDWSARRIKPYDQLRDVVILKIERL